MKNKADLILEGLRPNSINEGKVAFKKYWGVRLEKDFGGLKKGTLFYCNDVDTTNNLVRLAMQNKESYTLILPISFAQSIFGEVSGLEKGKTYTLDIEFKYEPIEVVEDWFDINPAFIKKYTKKDWLVFPKGTKFKYLGADMSGDIFSVDGVTIPISNVDDIPKAKEVSDIFKETRG